MQTFKYQKMYSTSYALMLLFSLFSQGFLLSVSKSMKKAEDDVLLRTFSLGKILQNSGKTEKSWPASSLQHYKIEDSSFLDEEEDGTPNFYTVDSKHHTVNRGQPPNLDFKKLPYFALEGSMTFPGNADARSIGSTQERRETEDDDNSAKLPIGRRDFDVLRCMLGRVYRPCWQV